MIRSKVMFSLLAALLALLLFCVNLSVQCTMPGNGCVSPQSLMLRIVAAVFALRLGGLLLLNVWRTHRYAQRLAGSAVDLPHTVQAVIDETGIDYRSVVILDTRHPLVFCIGFLRPKICFSTGLIDLLPSAQLQAALFHEEYHRRHRDPLLIMFLDAISKTLFFLPVVGECSAHLKTARELAADAYAVEQVGKNALAGALHRLLSSSPASMDREIGIAAAGMSANRARIAALLGERHPIPPISPISLLQSAAVGVLLCFVLMAQS